MPYLVGTTETIVRCYQFNVEDPRTTTLHEVLDLIA